MNQDRKDFLNFANLPARLGVAEAAWLLGFSEPEISVLISTGLLTPLGRPPQSGSKYFATVEIQMFRGDARWLARASDAIVNHWKKKNASRKSHKANALAENNH